MKYTFKKSFFEENQPNPYTIIFLKLWEIKGKKQFILVLSFVLLEMFILFGWNILLINKLGFASMPISVYFIYKFFEFRSRRAEEARKIYNKHIRKRGRR